MTLATIPTHTVDVDPPRRNDWVELMRPAAELAKAIADTEFVPAELRHRTEAIAACILYGHELGIGAMVSLAKIDIIKGRPAPKAELGRSLAFGAGHEIWFDEVTNTRVVACGKRRNSTHIFRVQWTLDDARKAGVAGNPAYAKYPRQMLVARASAELVRQMCPEVLGGITVFAEEAVDLPDDAPGPVAPAQALGGPPAGATTTKRSRNKTAASSAGATEPSGGDDTQLNARTTTPGSSAPGISGSTTAPPDTTKRTDAQTALAMALFDDLGITDRDERHKATSAILGEVSPTWANVTRDEASRVIDALEKLKAGDLHFVITDDGRWTVQPTTSDDDLFNNEEDGDE